MTRRYYGPSWRTERAGRALAETMAAERARIDCRHCGRRTGAGATREAAREYPGQVILWQRELVREVAFRDGACAAVRFECQSRASSSAPWEVTWRDYVEDWKADQVIAALRTLHPAAPKPDSQ